MLFRLLALAVIVVGSVQCGGGQPRCDASTCPAGCCSAAGFCEVGNTAVACGYAGGSCLACTSGETCVGGQCLPVQCQPLGLFCTSDASCCSGRCNDGTCALPLPACSSSGGNCSSTADCCSGLACTNGSCFAP